MYSEDLCVLVYKFVCFCQMGTCKFGLRKGIYDRPGQGCPRAMVRAPLVWTKQFWHWTFFFVSLKNSEREG